ncbi:MAG: hypothetical protein ACU0A5_05930 [Salipiger marinus]|uniref:hypothetical protein n=1 Tax=Salipiger marinus TaxID=555512 RepID=UPI00405A0B9C
MMKYVASKIDTFVQGKLNEFFPAEVVLCNIGWVSLENPGIKRRPNFLNAFNFATEADEIEYIRQFTRDANIDIVREFYRQTNGMRLLADKFSVPGVLFHRNGFSGYDFNCVALDFSNHGGFALPAHSPESGLVIGRSHRRFGERTDILHDILTKSGEIIGGYFDAEPKVTDRFECIDSWLLDRITGAAKELQGEISQLKI